MRFTWLAVVVLAAGCAVEETKSDSQSSPLAAAAAPTAVLFAPHAEPALGLTFPLATTGTTYKLWDFDPNLPARKFRHEIRLSSDHGSEIVIDVWDNPEHLDVERWFAATLGDDVSNAIPRTERPMTRARRAGLLLEEAASDQSPSEATAIFVTHDRAYLVSCLRVNEDASASRSDSSPRAVPRRARSAAGGSITRTAAVTRPTSTLAARTAATAPGLRGRWSAATGTSPFPTGATRRTGPGTRRPTRASRSWDRRSVASASTPTAPTATSRGSSASEPAR